MYLFRTLFLDRSDLANKFQTLSQRKSNKIQQCIKILFHIYMKLNMFHRVPDNVHKLHVQQPSTYAKPEAASAVLGS